MADERRDRDFSLSHAARKIGIPRQKLAEMCEAGEVKHTVNPWCSQRKWRRIPLAEIERLRPKPQGGTIPT